MAVVDDETVSDVEAALHSTSIHFTGLEDADQTNPKSPMDDGRTMISEGTFSVGL